MPFLNTASTYTLSALGLWEVLDSSVQQRSQGWDTCNVVAAARLGEGAGASLAAATAFPRGTVLLGTTLYAVECVSRCAGGGVWLCEIQGKGMVGTRPVRQTGGATVINTSPENLQIGPTIYPRAEVADATPSFDREYLTTSAPPTASVGLAGSPSDAPAVRPSIWGSIVNPTFHYPNGWVLLDVQYERLLNLSLWLVTERWEYRLSLTP